MFLSSLIDFILVRTQFGGNAGAAARALKNTGFENLIFIDPAFSKKDDEVLKFAVGAKNLVEEAKIYPILSEAIVQHSFILGTSRRTGGYRKNWIELSELPSLIETLPQTGRIAILFGTEANGLSNEDLDVCQSLIHIPSASDLESYNLAQAVLLVAFELFRSKPQTSVKPQEAYPTQAEREGMYQHLFEMLKEIGFMRKTTPFHMPRILRNIFNRANLTEAETRVIRGVCRQVLWYWRENQKKADEGKT